jgi:hypothetical protein
MDSEGKFGALICGEASDYIRERIHPFKDTLKSIFGEYEFQYKDSSTTRDGFINTRLDIFNRFAEKVSVYFFYRDIYPFLFFYRVTVLQLASTPTFCTKVALRRSTTVKEHLIFAKRREIHQINITL